MKLSDIESIARDLRAQLVAVGKRVDDLLTHVEAAKREPDAFAAFLFAARKSYSRACATDGKGGKRIESALQRSFFAARDFGFKGTIHDWQALLRLPVEPVKRNTF